MQVNWGCRRAGNPHGDVTDASGGHCRSHARQTSGLLFVESLRCGPPPPAHAPLLFDFLPTQVPAEAQTAPCVGSSVPRHTFPKQAHSKTRLVAMALRKYEKKGGNHVLTGRGRFLTWRGLVMCVRLFAPVLPRWRAAWQNHYGLCKHTLTSQFKSLLPHTHT